MTIITKPLSEKKGDKLEVPLVLNAEPPAGRNLTDVESGSILTLQRRAQKVSNLTTCCLLLTGLAVVGLGIIGGTFLYEQYMRVQLNKEFKLNIPYREDDLDSLRDIEIQESQAMKQMLQSFQQAYLDDNGQFPEEVEIDTDVEKINVPDFKNGRNGRFIHDFNTNITGIIDITGNRCFVMPLNRGAVLPPKSLFDLIHKMWGGYYTVDTNVVRQTMRVVTPPIDDPKSIGSYIGKECEGKPIYKLEKYVGGVVKRSADHKEAKFTEFAGHISEVDIVNYGELEAFEKTSNVN